MTHRFAFRKILAAALSLATTGSFTMAIAVPTPAHAFGFSTVFDPTNYAQNLLTAARALAQINNQIQSLQNEAQMLVNQEKNLTRIDFPQLQAITEKLQQIDRLMAQAQGIDFKVDQFEAKFRALFPSSIDQLLRTDQRVAGAKARLDAAMAAFKQTMNVQAQVVENVRDDARTLSDLVGKSQGAEGSLQAQQATNQLLALTAKQQFQLQTLMAAQFRSETMEQARRVQSETEGRAATKKFLGSGKAYTPD
jgi:type IV secretion system protein TrbJ